MSIFNHTFIDQNAPTVADIRVGTANGGFISIIGFSRCQTFIQVGTGVAQESITVTMEQSLPNGDTPIPLMIHNYYVRYGDKEKFTRHPQSGTSNITSIPIKAGVTLTAIIETRVGHIDTNMGYTTVGAQVKGTGTRELAVLYNLTAANRLPWSLERNPLVIASLTPLIGWTGRQNCFVPLALSGIIDDSVASITFNAAMEDDGNTYAITDNFNRANASLTGQFTPVGNREWVAIGTAIALVVQSNAAHAAGPSHTYASYFFGEVCDIESANMDVQGVIRSDSGWATGAYSGLTFRVENPATATVALDPKGWIFGYSPSADQYALLYNVGNAGDSGEIVASVPTSVSPYNRTGTSLQVIVNGTSIRCFVNGVEVIAISDARSQANTFAGITLRNNGGNVNVDNFDATQVAYIGTAKLTNISKGTDLPIDSVSAPGTVLHYTYSGVVEGGDIIEYDATGLTQLDNGDLLNDENLPMTLSNLV